MTSTTVESRIETWDRQSRPYIIAAAVAPIFVALVQGREVTLLHTIVDGVAWVIFVADLLVRRLLDRRYLQTGSGVFDLVIVVLTFPWYLLPGVAGAQFMSVFRAARLVRLVRATRLGVRTVSLLRRLGTLGVWLGITSLVAALIVKQAEPPEVGFETFGDALWWAMVSFTTVGYGDLFPTTPLGRLAGVLMMFAGLAALGTLAAILGSSLGAADSESEDSAEQRILGEIRALQAEVADLRHRLEDE